MADFTKRQREIIESSIRLISDKGIQNLTIKNLANDMKISEPAIYRHFGSKMDILIAVLESFNEKTRKSLTSAAEGRSDSIARIKSIFTSHMEILTDNPSLASVIFSEEIFQNDKKLSEMVFFIMKGRMEVITDIIRKGQENRQIRSDIQPDELSLILLGSLRLIVTKWRLSNQSFDLKERGFVLLESLLKMIG